MSRLTAQTLSHRDKRAALIPSTSTTSSSAYPPGQSYSPYSTSQSPSPAPSSSFKDHPPSQSRFGYGAGAYGAGGYQNGNAGPAGPSSNSSWAYADRRTADDLEGQNDEELEGLAAKVKVLKSITQKIGEEARDSAKFFSSMNDTFEETSSFLGTTFRRMNKMAKTQGGRWWYWMLFLLLVFWIFVFRWIGFI